MAEFDIVIALVVVVTVEAGDKGNARAGDGGFEALGLSNNEIRRDAAIGPPTHAEPVGVGNALGNGVVHHCHVVLIIPVAPVGIDCGAEFLAVARRAARIREQNRVAVGGIQLSQMVEGGSVLAHRSAVRIQQCRDFLSRRVIEGLVQIPGDGGAVLAFEVYVVCLRETQLLEQGVIGFRETRWLISAAMESSLPREYVPTAKRPPMGRVISPPPTGMRHRFWVPSSSAVK